MAAPPLRPHRTVATTATTLVRGIALRLAIALLLAGCELSGKAAGGRPNLLVLVIDALRADHLGGYGYRRATSPSLDALAARGVRFARVTSASNRTRSALPSLWTGLLPSHHGTLLRNDTMAPELVTAAELFGAHGYQTVAQVANPVLTARFGLDQGWDVYAETDVVLRAGEDWRRHESAAKLQASFLSWLDHTRDAQRPFLAWIHYWDVHGPYLPPPGYREMFPPEVRRPLTRDEIDRIQDGLRLPIDDREHYVSSYDAEIRYVDDRIAELLAALAARGLDRSTYVVVTADHGEAFLEHGSWDHGESLHEEQIHVPLIIAGPGLGPRTVERVVSSLDVFPTLLDLASIPAPPSDGMSLRPLLTGDTGGAPYGRTVAVSEASHRRAGMHRAARDAERKLLLDDLAPSELFDVARDPGETTDRLAVDPAAAAALRAALVDQLAARPIAPQAREATVDPRLDRQLRALGYAE